MGEQRHDVSSSEAGVVNHSCSSSKSRNEQRSTTRIWTDAEVGSYDIAEVAIADLYENCKAMEKAPVLPIAESIPAAYPNTPDSCKENVLSANCPGIMSVEDAKRKLESERKGYWTHLEENPKLRSSKRRAQNRINKYISRWKRFFYLETAEDYHILACEIRNKRMGQIPQREGRQRSPEGQPSKYTSQPLSEERRS